MAETYIWNDYVGGKYSLQYLQRRSHRTIIVVADTWYGGGVSGGIVKHQWRRNMIMMNYYIIRGVTGRLLQGWMKKQWKC